MRLLLLLFFLPALAIGQSRTITGIVVDKETGEPLIGVPIIAEHISSMHDTLVGTGCTSNANAIFALDINWLPPPRIITIRFYFPGYHTRSVILEEFGDSTTIDLGAIGLESAPISRPEILHIFKPMIDKRATNFRSSIHQDDIRHIPLR